MIKGEHKRILWEIFDVLLFFESERQRALDGFKRKFAIEILKELEKSFEQHHREWIVEVTASKQYDRSHPYVAEIQKTIDSAYPREKIDELSRAVFKKILTSYVDFMVQKVDPEKGEKLIKIMAKFSSLPRP